jgi:hypothetical protein
MKNSMSGKQQTHIKTKWLPFIAFLSKNRGWQTVSLGYVMFLATFHFIPLLKVVLWKNSTAETL